jgi:hypothetical protein
MPFNLSILDKQQAPIVVNKGDDEARERGLGHVWSFLRGIEGQIDGMRKRLVDPAEPEEIALVLAARGASCDRLLDRPGEKGLQLKLFDAPDYVLGDLAAGTAADRVRHLRALLADYGSANRGPLRSWVTRTNNNFTDQNMEQKRAELERLLWKYNEDPGIKRIEVKIYKAGTRQEAKTLAGSELFINFRTTVGA